MNKLKFLVGLCALAMIGSTIFSGCKGKDGEIGPAGANGSNGTNGIDGVDANETCKLCHNPEKVDLVVEQYEFSKHSYGEAAFEESGNTTCGACHTSMGFKYVVENNVPATFTVGTNGKYANDYQASSSNAYGEIVCFTCHSSLHTTYTAEDLPALTTTAAVSMTMWGGAKSINLAADGGRSNLCVKCHQPRPVTTSTSTSDGNVLDYAALVSAPTATFYDNTSSSNKVSLSFRSGNHYGSVGAIYAGVGGVEFGTGYTNSPHTTVASCQDCHMATVTGRAGGHTFFAKGNFNGCNVTGCHETSPLSSTATKFTTTRATIKGLLEQLATKINTLGDGNPLLLIDTDTEANLWYNSTSAHYDGYLNLYNSSSNPGGYYGATGNPKFPNLTNAQFGTILNFQLVLREYSLGIHNTAYTQKLLENSLTAW
ncbi:MAG: hypothetical protein A2046_11735 [Bacteroidetes bacterium GWA2_30_7]|nr:MAG: hypothetical protein A2046_11735 [Bacteroidetes bacterium GWA2_30_7]